MTESKIMEHDNCWSLPPLELETHYRMLCKKYHPDSGDGDKDILEERFQSIQDIYDKIKTYRASPIDIDMSLTLAELYHGCIKEIIVPDHRGHPVRMAVVISLGIHHGQVITMVTDTYKHINVHVSENNNTRFVRDGYNLLISVDITLTQAILGDPILIGHFNRIIRIPVKIPHTNYRHIIPGMGMPINDIHYGDLYICYQVIFPNEITEELQHELLTLKY